MFKRFISYYRPYKKIFTLDMLASFLIAFIGVGYPIITRYMLSNWIPNKNITMIMVGGFTLLGIYIVRGLLRYFVQYYGHIMGVHMQADMRTELFTKLQNLPFSYYDNHETGTILTTVTNDLFDVSELAHHGPENVLVAGFTVLGSVIYLLTVNWVLGLILIAILPILLLVTWHFRKKFSTAMRKSREATAKINARVGNSIGGIRVTKAFTNEELERAKFELTNEEYVNIRTKIFSSMGQYFSISQFITDFFNVVVILFGGLLLYLGFNQFQVADYSTFVVSISLFITPVNQLIMFLEQLESASSGFERFVHITEEEEENIHSGSKKLNRIEGEIEFSHVSFAYAGNKKVLNDISFKLAKGKVLALVGPSGGGKTSICHLIPRFYFLKEGDGNIYIDNHNINEYTLESLRSNVGIVQQDVYLFAGTIRDNILYGKPDATEQELKDAAIKADIYKYIQSLPNGWDTDIGERGSKLSGGQKQRISIARIFLKNPPLLILDEATSALDNATELIIQTALHELAKNRTCIIVAHRLSTIKRADIIAVIDGGKIVEMGTHEDLLKLNGSYSILHKLQFRLDEEKTRKKIG